MNIGYQKPLLPRDALEWQDRAICHGEDPLFDELPLRATRKDRERVLGAIQVCGQCPVRDVCLMFGIQYRETGVWGGQYIVQGDVRPVVPRKPVYARDRRAA